jgi:hypothetical protein
MNNNDFLNGWKDICCFIGVKSVVTAMTYEKKYGMPVTRVGKTVVTTKGKLTEWIEGQIILTNSE